jgi:hypothetical protein
MPQKRKVLLEDFVLLKELELKLIHLKQLLDPKNAGLPLFKTDFTASGLIPLVLGKDEEIKVTGDIVEFFSKQDVKYRAMLLAQYKKIAAQMVMRIVDYNISIPGLDENYEVIIVDDEKLVDNGDGTFTDAGGNITDAGGNIIRKVQTVKEDK